MLRSRKEKIKKLKIDRINYKWEEAEIHNSKLDPEMKMIHINDVQYKDYMAYKEIEDLEFREKMLPLRWMLTAFIIFATAMLIYRILA